MRIDRHTPGTRLDRLVTQKASEALNAMPRRFRPTRSSGVQIRAFRRTEGVPRAGTSTCSGLAARWGKRTGHHAMDGHDQKCATFRTLPGYGRFCLSPTTSSVVRKGSRW